MAFSPSRGRGVLVTDDRILVNKMLAQAGSVMEDASVIALIGDGSLSLTKRIALLREALVTITRHLDAAEATIQRIGKSAICRRTQK